MKVYATIFNNSDLVVQVTVSPRINQDAQKQNMNVSDERVMRKYKSKIGNMSIIFDPVVALVISGKKAEFSERIIFGIRYTYQVMTTITAVYESMISNKTIYIRSGNSIIMDRAAAEKYARKIPTFSHELRIKPSLIDREGGSVIGLEFSSDMGYIATISHMDARLLIESLEHFDATTYTLLMGLAEQLSTMDAKLDIMKSELDEIRRDIKMLIENNDKINPSMVAPWHPMS